MGPAFKASQTDHWLMWKPPLGESTCPVMKFASSEARYTAAQAMSSGTPKRLIGVAASIRALVSPICAVMGVSM